MIHRFESLDSTNNKAKNMAMEGAPHGTVVIADRQTAGRGRLGRSFDSHAGAGIYMSLILRPNCPPAQLIHLTCAVGVAVCDGINRELGFRPGIKWINDLVVDSRKLGGILTELSINPASGLVDFAIVGIGINCNRNPEDFPAELCTIACSASMVTGHPVDREQIINQIIYEINTLDLSQNEQIMNRYRQNCITLGKMVRIIRQNSVLSGTALDIDNHGALIVRFSDGHTERIDSGEVSVRGLYGYL